MVLMLFPIIFFAVVHGDVLKCNDALLGFQDSGAVDSSWRHRQHHIVEEYSPLLKNSAQGLALLQRSPESLTVTEQKKLNQFTSDWLDFQFLVKEIFNDVDHPELEIESELRTLIYHWLSIEIQRYRFAKTPSSQGAYGMEAILPPKPKRKIWFEQLYGVKLNVSESLIDSPQGWLTGIDLLGNEQFFDVVDLSKRIYVQSNVQASTGQNSQMLPKMMENWVKHAIRAMRAPPFESSRKKTERIEQALMSIEVFLRYATPDQIHRHQENMGLMFTHYIEQLSLARPLFEAPRLRELSLSIQRTLRIGDDYFGLQDITKARAMLANLSTALHKNILSPVFMKFSAGRFKVGQPEYFIGVFLELEKQLQAEKIPFSSTRKDLFEESFRESFDELIRRDTPDGAWEANLLRFIRLAVKGESKLYQAHYIPAVIRFYLEAYFSSFPVVLRRGVAEETRSLVNEIKNLTAERLNQLAGVEHQLVGFVFDRCLVLEDLPLFEAFLHEFHPFRLMWTGSDAYLSQGYKFYDQYIDSMLIRYRQGEVVFNPDFVVQKGEAAGLFVAFDSYAFKKLGEFIKSKRSSLRTSEVKILEWLILFRPERLNGWLYRNVYPAIRSIKLDQDQTSLSSKDSKETLDKLYSLLNAVHSGIYSYTPAREISPIIWDQQHVLLHAVAKMIDWSPSVHSDLAPQDPELLPRRDGNTNH